MAKGDYISWTEGTPVIGVADSDVMSAAEAAGLRASLSAADSFSAAEAAVLRVSAGSDAGSFLDALAALVVAAADTAVLAEGPPSTGVAGADSGTAAEGLPSVGLASSDTGTVAELFVLTVVSGDAGGVDAEFGEVTFVHAFLSDADFATALESAHGPADVVVFGSPVPVVLAAGQDEPVQLPPPAEVTLAVLPVEVVVFPEAR